MSKHILRAYGQRENEGYANIQNGRWQKIILLESKTARAIEAVNGHSTSLEIKGYTFGSRNYAEIAFPGHTHRPINERESGMTLGRFLFDGKAIGRVEALVHFLRPREDETALYAIRNHQSVELWTPSSYHGVYPSAHESHSRALIIKPALLSAEIAESPQPAL